MQFTGQHVLLAPGTFSETPQRHLAAEPFDARCCRGYWIKVPPVRGENNFTRPASPCHYLVHPPLLQPFPSQPRNAFSLGVTSRKKLTIALPSLSFSLSFGFPRLVVFLCRQNGRRRHLALNIYGKVPFATAKLRRPFFSRFLVPAD